MRLDLWSSNYFIGPLLSPQPPPPPRSPESLSNATSSVSSLYWFCTAWNCLPFVRLPPRSQCLLLGCMQADCVLCLQRIRSVLPSCVLCFRIRSMHRRLSLLIVAIQYTEDNEHWASSSSQASECSVEPGTAEDVGIIVCDFLSVHQMPLRAIYSCKSWAIIALHLEYVVPFLWFFPVN